MSERPEKQKEIPSKEQTEISNNNLLSPVDGLRPAHQPSARFARHLLREINQKNIGLFHLLHFFNEDPARPTRKRTLESDAKRNTKSSKMA